jgi:hypothetical protein
MTRLAGKKLGGDGAALKYHENVSFAHGATASTAW